jgi:uncharacterized membrane protein YgcG
MRCLVAALFLAVVTGLIFTPFVGLFTGVLLFILCRLVAKHRHSSDSSNSSSDSSNSSSSDSSSSWAGSGGLFGGAGAASAWDSNDNLGGDSGGGDGGSV